MEGFDTIPLAFLKKILSFSGIWPILKPSKKYISVFFVSFNLISAYFVQAINFLSDEFNIKSSVIYMAYLCTTISMGAVYFCSLLKKKYIFSFFIRLIDDWVTLENTKEYDVLIKYANYAKKCISLWIASYVFYATCVFLQSFKSVLLDVLIPLNKTRQRNLMYTMSGIIEENDYFCEILIVQYVIFLVLGFSIISGLSIYFTILLHICAMFRIIGCLLDNIINGKEKGLEIIDNELTFTRIIRIIKIHDKTFKYVDAYNTNFNVITLIMVTCALCFIGGATFHIMDTIDKNKKEDIAGLLFLPIIYVIFHLIWVFIWCNIGQHLKNVTEAVFYKANETPWYLLSKQSKILLFLMIVRASKPTYVSVGNMFIASHEFFAQLVKMSMSYAMVLHSRN